MSDAAVTGWHLVTPGAPLGSRRVCESVDEFVLALSTRPMALSHMNVGWKGTTLYRGQSDSRWKLTPTAFRRREDGGSGSDELWAIARSHHGSGLPSGFWNDHEHEDIHFQAAEIAVAVAFVRHAEQAGLPLPHLSGVLRDDLLGGGGRLWNGILGSNGIPPSSGSFFPDADLIPIFALAQHYGLPTRLLDWSLSPLVAAYFAAAGCLRRASAAADDDTLSVWATSPLAGRPNNELLARMVVDRGLRGILFCAQPTAAQNPNLRAQRGLFTLMFDTIGDPVRQANSSLNLGSQDVVAQTSGARFYEVRLPARYAPELADRLTQLGYLRSRLVSGYQGVTESVLEEAALRRELPS